jgi:hypothetical protein
LERLQTAEDKAKAAAEAKRKEKEEIARKKKLVASIEAAVREDMKSEVLYNRLNLKSERLTSIPQCKDGLVKNNPGFNDYLVLSDECTVEGIKFKLPLNDRSYELRDLGSKDREWFDIRNPRANSIAMDSGTWAKILQQGECVLRKSSDFDMKHALKLFLKHGKGRAETDKDGNELKNADGTLKMYTQFSFLREQVDDDLVRLKTAYFYADPQFTFEGIPEEWVTWKKNHLSHALETEVNRATLRRYRLAEKTKEPPPGWKVEPMKKAKVKNLAADATATAAGEKRTIAGVDEKGKVKQEASKKGRK